jgi:hypothetical protein
LLLTDGTRLSASHDSGVPATDTADQGRRLEEKFAGLVEPVLGVARCRSLIDRIAGVDNLGDAREMVALTGA